MGTGWFGLLRSISDLCQSQLAVVAALPLNLWIIYESRGTAFIWGTQRQPSCAGSSCSDRQSGPRGELSVWLYLFGLCLHFRILPESHFSERVWPTGPGDLPPAAPSLSGGTPTGQAASSQTPSEVWKICEQGRNMLGTKINDWCLGRGWGGSRQVPSGLQKRQQKILTPENGRGWWEVNRNG